MRDGIVLRTNESAAYRRALSKWALSTESVQVTGAPPLLETETSASGGVLGVDTFVKIPVLQKLVFRLTLYLPGTQVVNGLHAVGQRERSMGYMLDGLSAKEPVRGPVKSNQPGDHLHHRRDDRNEALHHRRARRVRPLRRRPALGVSSAPAPTSSMAASKTAMSTST